MELGELELAVLRAVRSLGETTTGEIHREVKKTRDVAYTSVTTTLYRLVDKDVVQVRRESEKKVYYRVRQGRAYRRAMSSMIDRLVDTFGEAAVSYILANPGSLPAAEMEAMKVQIEQRRSKEKSDG